MPLNVTKNTTLSRSEVTIINLFTSALAWIWPVLLSFATMPFIVKGLGNDAYGIRGLVLSITGYFALLDLGLNGAVTKYLAEYKALNDKALITELLGTTLTTYTLLGLVGGTLIWFLAGWFTKGLFAIPQQFYDQSIWAFRLTGVGFFLSMISWWGSSIPTGLQRFDVINGISIGFGTLTTLSTLVAVLLGYGLLGVVWVNLFSNVLAIIAYLISERKLLPEISLRFSFNRYMFKRTVWFGMYMVAFRIFSLLFAQLDSLLIGMWIGPIAITFYMVPMQVAQIVHGVNGKMMQIIFPMVSELSVMGDKKNIDRIFVRGLNLCLVIGLAVAVPLAAVTEPLLRFWMSPEIARQSTIVMELLVLTFLFAGLTAHITSFLGGINYPQLVTLGSVISGFSGLIFYTLLIKLFGINGAAFAKFLSIIITIFYYLAVCRCVGKVYLIFFARTTLRPFGIAIVVGSLSYWLLVPQAINLWATILIAICICSVFCLACWFLGVFDTQEKQSLYRLSYRLLPSLIKDYWKKG